MTIDQIKALDEKYYMRSFGGRSGIAIDHGRGSYVFDTDGKRYLDMLGGIAVTVVGHAHPLLVAAISQQAEKLLHCSNHYYIEAQAKLAEQLCHLTNMERCFLANSGAEANEAAIKLARAYHYKKGQPRAGILSIRDSFHGRTLATVTATGQSKYNEAYAPLPPGFRYLPFNDLAALEAALDEDSGALILELIQGESGIHPLSQEYVTEAAALCRKNDTLLIVDEIQSGMGRCGHFTACQAYGIEADIITLAKGLGGGVPIAACLAGSHVSDVFTVGDHGSTFGGNPLACAAALAILEIYEKEKLIQAAAERGAYLVTKLKEMIDRLSLRAEIRGLGLMLAIELFDHDALKLRERLQEKGVLVNGIAPHTLRLLPPLTITEDELLRFVQILQEAITEEVITEENTCSIL